MVKVSLGERASMLILAKDGLTPTVIGRLLERDARTVRGVLEGREDRKPGPPIKYPDRATVLRIVGEEAQAHSARIADVLGASNKARAKRARTAAVMRIMSETGCSHRGLEKIWGASLKRLARRNVRRESLEVATMERLVWIYGEARAEQIAAGRDPKTQRDIAAWNRLCALGDTHGSKRQSR